MNESSSVEEFRHRAIDFCAHLEAHSTFHRGPFVRQVAIKLAQLYAAGSRLPEVASDSDDLLPDVVSDGQQQLLRNAISEKLREFQIYWEMFDPFAEDDTEPVAGTVAGELVEIYCDLQKVISGFNRSATSEPDRDVLWTARFDFVHHWSRHASSCLKAVDAMLNMHFVEALEPEVDRIDDN